MYGRRGRGRRQLVVLVPQPQPRVQRVLEEREPLQPLARRRRHEGVAERAVLRAPKNREAGRVALTLGRASMRWRGCRAGAWARVVGAVGGQVEVWAAERVVARGAERLLVHVPRNILDG